MQRPSSSAIRTLDAHEIDHVAGGELFMLALQDVVSQRSRATTVLSNMLKATQSSTNTIIGNIK